MTTPPAISGDLAVWWTAGISQFLQTKFQKCQPAVRTHSQASVVLSCYVILLYAKYFWTFAAAFITVC